MKKLFLSAVIIIALLLCGCVNKPAPEPSSTEPAYTESAAGPTAEPDPTEAPGGIFEGVHEREEGYNARFSTHGLENALVCVNMENGIFEAEKLNEYAKALYETLEKAGETCAAPARVTAFILRKTLNGAPVILGDKLFISEDDVKTGAYRSALLGCAYGLEAEWQRRGLEKYVFGEAADESGVKEFFSQPQNALAASLSPLFSMPELAGEERAELVKRAADCLAAFTIETMGFEAFRSSPDTAKLLPEWTEHLGVAPIELPKGSERAARMSVVSRRGRLCVIEAENFSFEVWPEFVLGTPEELYSLICNFYAGLDEVEARLTGELPSLAALIRERMAEEMRIECIDSREMTVAYPTSNRIELSHPCNVWHELVHLLLEPLRSNEDLRWEGEALAEHFTLDTERKFYPTDYYCRGLERFAEFMEEESGRPAAEDDATFQSCVIALYERLRSPEITETDDIEAGELAYGIAQLMLPELERTQVRRRYDISVEGKVGMDSGRSYEQWANALTYPQAHALYDYMASVYGADRLAEDHVNGVPVEETTGMSYTELLAAAREYYGGLYAEVIDGLNRK